MSVHILEDDPGVLDSMVILLEELGHNVVAHVDAESFFDKTVPSGTDTVIVDLGLPGINGSQVVRWVMKLREKPRVFVISGQVQSDIDSQLKDFPEVALVKKPLTEDQLVSFVHQGQIPNGELQ